MARSYNTQPTPKKRGTSGVAKGVAAAKSKRRGTSDTAVGAKAAIKRNKRSY